MPLPVPTLIFTTSLTIFILGRRTVTKQLYGPKLSVRLSCGCDKGPRVYLTFGDRGPVNCVTLTNVRSQTQRWPSLLASLFYLYLAQPSQSHIVCMLMPTHTYTSLSQAAPPLEEGLTTDPHRSLMRANRSDADKREAICMRLLITSVRRPAGAVLNIRAVLALTLVPVQLTHVSIDATKSNL